MSHREANVVFKRLASNYDEALSEIREMCAVFENLYGFHDRSFFNTTLTSLCAKGHLGFRQALVTVVCKTSAVSRDDKVGLKKDGLKERLLNSFSESNHGGTNLYKQFYNDLLDVSDSVQSGFEDWGSLASAEVEPDPEREREMERDECRDEGNDGNGNPEKNESDMIDGLRNSAKISDMLDKFESSAYKKMTEEFGAIEELEEKVKKQAEAIAVMEASIRREENIVLATTDVDKVNESHESDHYDDDFEFESSGQLSPMKSGCAKATGIQERDEGVRPGQRQKQEMKKDILIDEGKNKIGKSNEAYEAKAPECYQPTQKHQLDQTLKSLQKTSTTSDILSMADRLLDEEDDGPSGDKSHMQRKKGAVVKKKRTNERKRLFMTKDDKREALSTQVSSVQEIEPKVVSKLRKVVKSSSAPDSTVPSQGRGRLRAAVETSVSRLEKALAAKDMGAVELLKLLREKSTMALDILRKANDILNKKLNTAYNVALEDMQKRHCGEVERLNDVLGNVNNENVINTGKAMKASSDKHRAEIYWNRLKTKQQAEADSVWKSLQEPLEHLDDVYCHQVQRIQRATENAAGVGYRSVQLMELYAKNPKIKNRGKLLEKLNSQTRAAVFKSCQEIADICGAVKHTYSSLSDALFTKDGAIVGMGISESDWILDEQSLQLSPKESRDDKSQVEYISDNEVICDARNSPGAPSSSEKAKVLSTHKSPNAVDIFNKTLDMEIVSHVNPKSQTPSNLLSPKKALEDALATTTALLSPGSTYEDDFERMSKSSQNPTPVKQEESPQQFLQSLNESSGLKPADSLLQASENGEYEDDFEEALSPVARYENIKLSNHNQTESKKKDHVAECERLGIDPTSSWRLLDRRADLANPRKANKKVKKKNIQVDRGDSSQCSLCKKIYYGEGKAVPNMSSLDQPAVDVVKGMMENGDGRKAVCQSPANERLFCSWKCVKMWNKKNTPLQLRYHTEVMIDFAAALASKA